MTGIQLHAEHDAALPRLGWVCKVDTQARRVDVRCGEGVEIGDDFVVEGIWDGAFAAGEFHRARHFFGSGVKVLGDDVIVVPSRALVDRVVLATSDGGVWASNSLLLLLAVTARALDPDVDYLDACHAVIAGTDDYDPHIDVVGDDALRFVQHYHRPLVIRAGTVTRQAATPPVPFASFDAYHAALHDALAAIVDNAAAPQRRTPISHFTSTSTGYDSAAVSALARSYGVTRCFTTDGARTLDGMALEDGRPVARALSLEPSVLTPGVPDADVEQIMLGTTPDGRETLFSDMFEQFAAQQSVACLWSGYHGDKLWDRATSGGYLDPQIKRGDMSGFNLGEIRLVVGFLNLSVPFMFASSIADLVAVANASEMAPWQVGGDYDRPIPRRIAEQAGVPREAFGQSKARIMEYYSYCRNPELAQAFRDHLASERGFGAIKRSAYEIAERLDYLVARSALLPEAVSQRISLKRLLRPGASNLSNALYVWAANRCASQYAEKYREALQRFDS